MGSLYNRVKVNNPGHSFFNLSYEKKFNCDMGQLIPITCQFLMPNDHFKVGNEIVARMSALVSPVMHEINIYTQYFFVPLRIMFGAMKTHTYPHPSGTKSVSEWEVYDRDFETFLTGGKTGYDTTVSMPRVNYGNVLLTYRTDTYSHPMTWLGTEYNNGIKHVTGSVVPAGTPLVYRGSGVDIWTVSDGTALLQDSWSPLYENEIVSAWGKYSLSDYLEMPVVMPNNDCIPLAFPWMAYSLVWNNFFRDQTLMEEVDPLGNFVVKNVCWNKDYFTAAYTELQRGQSPALPLSNSLLPVYFDAYDTIGPGGLALLNSNSVNILGYKDGISVYHDADGNTVTPSNVASFKVDASGLFNVNDLRLANKVQEWLETNLRVGEHLNEFLIGHFGIGPHDETLQRPVYLGGSKSPVIVSEVLQTSETTSSSPQGNMSGHGISADRNYICSYRAKEFGVLIGVMYIRPKSNYMQGVNRQWLYETKYDLPFPEFCHLGNQAIFESEIYYDSNGNVDADGNPLIFGYTERYNELRSNQSAVCGGMRDTFDFWHLGRKFANAPNLNADFVRCVPSKRIFASETEPGFIVNVGNIIHAYRPIPTYGEPRT